MVRPGVCVLSLLALSLACVRPVVRVATRHAPGPSHDALELLPAWRDRPVAVALPDGAVGLLFGGVRVRWEPASGAVEVARDGAAVALVEARSLARGVLFRDERQRLWRAESFLAPLTSLGDGAAAFASPPESVGGAAIRRDDGTVVSDGREERLATGLPPGAPFELSFCDAAHGYSRAADGLLDRTDDGGRTWRPTADEGVVCTVAETTVREPSPAVIARARAEALRTIPALLDAMPSATLDDGRGLVATTAGVESWSPDRATVTPLLRATGCEVAAWGSCAAVLCEGAALHRVCADGALQSVAHPCRGAFVLSDDGRHALCATASLDVRLLDADTGADARAELPFRALVGATLHGDVARAVYDGALHRVSPREAAVQEALPIALAAVAQLGEGHLVGYVGDRLWWRGLGEGTWRPIGGLPTQSFGGEGSRFLARGDISPTPPRFECRPDACRFGAAIVRRPDALPVATAPATPPSTPEEAPVAPAVVDVRAIDRCSVSAPLTHRRSLPGIPFDAPVHAALEIQGATATVRWMTVAGVRAVALAEATLPGPLSPGDEPQTAFPQGVPAAIAADARSLHLVTADGIERSSLWTLTVGGATPRVVSLPGALPPLAGDALWEGEALADGGVFVVQSVIADEVATVRAWTLSAAGEVTASFQTRSRELPYLARVDGAPGVVTWTPRRGGELDVAFRGAAVARRWRVRVPTTLGLCTTPGDGAAYAEVPVDARSEREGVTTGTAARSVVRVTRARVRLAADGLCVDGLLGVTGGPAANGRGLFAADLFLSVRGGALSGHEHDGMRALPLRCAAP
jgi:hypothetical protein